MSTIAAPARVAGGDHLVVALRAAGLDQRAVAPALIAVSGPSGKGKNASEATAEPASSSWASAAERLAGLVDRDPDRVDAAHLAGADPERRPVLGEDDRVRAHVPADLPREQQVGPLLLGRLGLGRPRVIDLARLVDPVGVLDQQPAGDALHVALAGDVVERPRSASRIRTASFCVSTSIASGSNPGASSTSMNCWCRRPASSRADRTVEDDHAAEGR